MPKNVLEFKLEFSEKETITPYAGLGLYGEMYKALGIGKEVKRLFPEPGSGIGYTANEYLNPLVMMFIGGGKYIEDIGKIAVDKGLCKVCKIEGVPSSDAVGDWLNRESGRKAGYLKEINNNLILRLLRKTLLEEFTLDIDATEIIAEKEGAEWTYKGNKGYMPLLGFIVELGICAGYEFREGNESPGSRNYEFSKEVIELVEEKSEKKIKYFRSDSAAYNSEVFNYLNSKGIMYTITADQDVAVKREIALIKEWEWKELKDEHGHYTGRRYGEFIHSMNGTDHSFRVIVQRWPNPQRDLFEESSEYCYHCMATNFAEEEKRSEEVVWWHNGRSNSENYNKEIKIGFNLEYLPSGSYGANSVWFGIGILAYNLFIASKLLLFPVSWAKKTIRTVRWQFIQIAGKVMSRGRSLILRICSTLWEIYAIYKEARRKCWELREGLGIG